MRGDLAGRVAIVSGSGRGIGRAIATKLASQGARIVVNDLDAEPAERTAGDIRAEGGEAVTCPGSVADPDFPDRFVTTAVEAFDGLDIIVNNAGYTWDGVLQKVSDEQWHAMLDVHLTAPFRILRAAQPIVSAAVRAERTAGRPVPCRKVINVSSIAGLGGNPGQVAYAAAKAGLGGLTTSLAKEWGRLNVTVNTVAFGLIETRLTTAAAGAGATIEVAGRELPVGVNRELLEEMHRRVPLGRPGTPEEAAGAVVMLCRPDADYVSGQTISCAGGYSL